MFLKYNYRQPTYLCLQENLKKWTRIQVSTQHLIIGEYLITDEACLSILKVLHTVATVMCDFLCSNSKVVKKSLIGSTLNSAILSPPTFGGHLLITAVFVEHGTVLSMQSLQI